MKNLTHLTTLDGHTDTVWAVTWHPDGIHLASCSTDKSVRIWRYDTRTTTHKCIQVLDDHHKRTVRSVAFSQCDAGKYLASCSFDGTVVIYSRAVSGEYEFLATLEGHENEVKSVAWSPHAPLLATCGRDKSVWVWEMDEDEEFQCLAVMQEHSQDVKQVKWHPTNPEYLLSCSYDDTMRLWKEVDDEDWVSVGMMDDGSAQTVWSADFNSDGTVVASTSDDGSLKLWKSSVNSPDKLSYKLQSTSQAHSQCAYTVSWSRQNNLIATGSRDNSIAVFDPSSNRVIVHVDSAHESDVNRVEWNPDTANSNLLASCSDDGTIKIWRLST